MGVTRRKFLEKTGATALGAAAAVEAQGSQSRATGGKAPRAGGDAARRRLLTDRAPKPVGPYSQAMIAGETIYVAGQVAVEPRTGKAVEGGFEEQAVRVLENVKAIVEAAGAALSDVVRVNVYLSNLGDFAKMNEIYRRYFSEDYPARTTVGVQLLAQYLIEVDCIAVKRASDSRRRRVIK
jgi:2-iminobutanoate/2-iminopropanoate deaminase